MKLLHTAAWVLAASHAALAAPVTDSTADLIEYRSANPAHMARVALDKRELEKRINCIRLDRVIRAIGTSKMTVIYITSANALARSICEYVHGESCAELSNLIQTGFTLIYIAAAHYSGAQPETLPGARKRDVHAELADWWTGAIDAHEGNVTYDSISKYPFDTKEEALGRRDGDPALVSRVFIEGVTAPHNPHVKQDIIAHQFADGNTLLHLPIGPTTGELDKRVPAGAGFKMSYTTRVKTLLTYSHQQEMSAFAAAAWAVDSKAYAMTDFIGFAETGHSANFYYRIIPETRGFGLNYESVDICGGMASFL